MTEPLVYRSMRAGEGPAVVDLYSRVFGVPYSLEHWSWQYADGPRANLDEVFLCCSGDVLAGHTASVPAAYLLDGQPIGASHIQNICVDPTFRKRGIFTGILHEIRDYHDASDYLLATGHPNALSYPLMMRTGHYTHLFDIYPVGLSLDALGPAGDSGLRVEVSEPVFGPADTALFDRELAGVGVRNSREVDYLDWRFGATAPRDYRVVRAFDGEVLRGLAVAKIYAPGALVDLVEWIAEDDDALIRALLQGVAEAFGGGAVRTFETWSMEHNKLHPRLLGLGFERVERPTPFIARAPNDSASKTWMDAEAWFMSMADSDVY